MTRWLSLLVVLFAATLCGHGTHATMHASERRHLRDRARAMFYHGYNSYMDHAFPWDELKPLSCEGRRWDQRERGDLDDVLGGFALTLVDSLDMLAVLGDRDEFRRAVHLVIDTVSFDRDVTVSVFESTIRIIGGLISAHLIASPSHLGVLTADEYNGELLDLAVDLGQRLLPAFDTPTQIPVHRINLRHGLAANAPAITCPAAAGSLLVEFAYLSRLSGLSVFEDKARDAVVALWRRRSELNLLGSSIDVFSGEWTSSHVGIGAGLDSFFEYLLKYHLVSGNTVWRDMFNLSYSAVETHMNHQDFHLEVDMHHGRDAVRFQRVSALQAFWPGLQVLAGDVSSAIRSHDNLFLLWNKYGAMPELFDLASVDGGVIPWARTSPLRPELIESTYHLYQATRDHKYLKIGRKLLEDMERVSRVDCGYAAVGNIHTLAVEDRMDSYFLSETVKYLYLLFSDDPDVIVPAMPLNGGSLNASIETEPHLVNVSFIDNTTTGELYSRVLKSSEVVFSTEGHVLHVDAAIFERKDLSQPGGSSSTSPAFWCENGHALIHKEKQRQATPTAAATKPSITFVPIGVSVRVGDVHVTTAVASPATFGHQFGRFGHVEAPLLLFSHRVGNACEPFSRDLQAEMTGRIVVVARGQCSFADKALHVQQAGGKGMIIINTKRRDNAAEPPRYMITDDSNGAGARVRIPLVLMSRPVALELHRAVRLKLQLMDREAGGTDELPSSSSTTGEDDVVVSLSAWLY
jgi:hypothetical protein